MTRLLVIMGSGETAPTMTKVHRGIVERVGGPAVLLDTPYGFQENADDISAKAQGYFATSVGHAIGVASLRTAEDPAVEQATAVARIGEANYVFAGPGSPTYALRVWRDTPVPAVLADKLTSSGAVTFASAAALTLGVVTVPVYEIYKAGEVPEWYEGLNLLESGAGLRAAVIPHYDNAEGGHHDTRFCYLGERRLALLERSLPEGAFVLGVDEHTGVVLDLDDRSATVVGNGLLTIRARGTSTVFPTGSVVGFDDLLAAAEGTAPTATGIERSAATPPAGSPAPGEAAPSLLRDANRLEGVFVEALADRQVNRAVGAVLELDDLIQAWAADTFTSDEMTRARATLRSMIVRLGELAHTGAADPRDAVASLVEVLLAVRAEARATKDFATSDRVRDGLASAGIEVRDTAQGVEWHLSS